MSGRDDAQGLLGHVVDACAELPPWLTPHVARLLARRAAMPHALLLSGGPAAAPARLAEALTAGLLCDMPGQEGMACGDCASCRLLAAGNHPDLLWLSPMEADEESGRKGSQQIRIEAVRQLIGALAFRPHHSAMRVSVIDPAEAMNPATANALLKVLEEPQAGNLLLLISRRPLRLLPTLRSRCIELRVVRPAGLAWAREAELADAELAAFLRDPAPDQAARDLWGGQRVLLEVLARGERLPVAAGARTPGLSLPAALDVLSRWVHDLARVKAGGSPRFLPSRLQVLGEVSARADLQGLLYMARRLAEWQRHASHPLNVPLTLADILLEYRAELFPPARAA